VSQFNAIGETGLSEVLTKRLTTPGGSSAPSVAPEIFPCLVLENDRPEWLRLAGSGLYSRGTSVTAGGAGTRSSAQIINAQTRTLVVVERVEIAVAAGLVSAYTIMGAPGALPIGTQIRGQARDSRWPRTPAGQPNQSTALIIIDNTLGLAGTSAAAALPATAVITQPWVLAPGDAMYVCPNADNVAITYVSFFWRERPAQPGELA